MVARLTAEQPIQHALHRTPMVRRSSAQATERPVLAPLVFEVWSAEEPAASAALPSVYREKRSSTSGACERQAHDSIVAQSRQGCGILEGRGAMSRRGTSKRGLIDTGRNKAFAKRDAKGQFKDIDDVGRSLTVDRRAQPRRP